MSKQRESQNTKDSFLYPDREQNPALRFLQKFDFFSFIPVPKDQPVSTKRSIIGSCIFIVLFLFYAVFDFYQFVSDNPPIIENAQSMLDQNFYTLPKVGIAFMKGENLNQTQDFSSYISFQMTKQTKGNSLKQSYPIPLQINNNSYLSPWLGNSTIDFYGRVIAPSEQMKAKGLLYSTQTSNYTKMTIRLCNLNSPNNTCQSFENISSLMAKGRLFLFIQETQDDSGVYSKSVRPNKFRIANFFLIPSLYKRVTVQFQVVKSTILPDFFHHFSTRQLTKLQLNSISQQTSNTTINDIERSRTPLEMLGITFQLSAQTLEVRVTYSTFLDHVGKWGAFFNVLFAIFAIFFLAYNKKRFYQKNPDWDKFKNRKRSDLLQSDPDLFLDKHHQ